MPRLALVAVVALVATTSSVAHATSPVGAVTVDCSRVEGWGQDPDDPALMIAVHLYFDGPAGDPAATGVPLTANLTLQGGCTGDQCSHGFRSALPLSRLDGAPHPVHAYGIDNAADPNLELAGSPVSYTCPPLPIVGGVKRHIVGPDILTQWQFSIFFDMMKVADIALAAVPESTVVDGPPQLALAEGTQEPLWLIDHGFRRPVPPEAVGPWRLVPANAAVMPIADLMALPEGTPLAPRPVLAQGSGPKVYLLDDYQCAPGDPNPACPDPVEPTTGEGPGETGDPTTGEAMTSDALTGGVTSGDETGVVTGGTGGTGSSSSTGDPGESEGEAGCGCRSTDPRGALALLLGLALVRRRRM
jgi:MYXO-CTERM domain-containing protein